MTTTRDIRELRAIHDGATSFYRKAMLEADDVNSIIYLYSYDTLAAAFFADGSKIEVYNTQSKTTVRHVKEFIKQLTGRSCTTQEIKGNPTIYKYHTESEAV